jgi:transposase
MRGEENNQSELFHTFSVECCIPKEHPLRRLKKQCELALKSMDSIFEAMYSDVGRPSIAPERLLKSQLLIALYSIRSDEQFCEMLGYNILFKWFLGMSMSESPFDRSSFSKNRARLIEHEVGREFLASVVELARKENLLSDEHFTVDGTLIEAWASLKSFRPKDEDKNNPTGSNPDVDFRGQKRCNDTHQSTTDKESKLFRKGKGKEAKLSFCGHTLMENRNGLIIDAEITKAGTKVEREAALLMIDRQEITRATLGGDKGYHAEEFIKDLRARKITPHIAYNKGRKGLDKRTTRHKTYQVSQRKRKLIEQGFGWLKSVGRMRKTTLKGIDKNNFIFSFRAAAFNLVRMLSLAPA